jgi:cytochrome c oxidase assembly protein subunit 11
VSPNDLGRKNSRALLMILAIVACMIGLSFASVPLYKVFCRATGFGGTTQVSNKAPSADKILNRTVNVKFNADVGRNLVWDFHPDQRQVKIRLGQQGLVTFTARNRDRVPVTAVAVYNVTPPKAGKYFHKIQCFCFGEQSLKAREKAVYPVIFFIDPAMNKDPNMQDVGTITLSYTFFPKDAAELDAAMERFYNQPVEKKTNAHAGTVALPPEKQ